MGRHKYPEPDGIHVRNSTHIDNQFRRAFSLYCVLKPEDRLNREPAFQLQNALFISGSASRDDLQVFLVHVAGFHLQPPIVKQESDSWILLCAHDSYIEPGTFY